MMKEYDLIERFPPLGHPEHHFNKWPDHPWLKTKEDIESWLKKNCLIGIDNEMCKDSHLKGKGRKKPVMIINDDLTVSLNKISDERITITDKESEVIPIQFKDVNSFIANDINLKSIIGVPYKVHYLHVAKNKLSSFEGINPRVYIETINIENNNFRDFSGLDSFDNIITFKYKGNPIESLSVMPKRQIWLSWAQDKWEENTDILIDSISDNVKNVIFNEDFIIPYVDNLKMKKWGDSFAITREVLKIENRNYMELIKARKSMDEIENNLKYSTQSVKRKI